MSSTKIMDQEMQDEMVGMLTAMSIVSKRLALRLANLKKSNVSDKQNERKVKT